MPRILWPLFFPDTVYDAVHCGAPGRCAVVYVVPSRHLPICQIAIRS